MTIRLIAEAVDDFGVEIVYSIGLSETAKPNDDAFALVFSITEPDRDACGYCIVAEPGQRTAYRAVRECALDEPDLHLIFTDDGAAELELPSELELELDLSRDDLALLRRGSIALGYRSASRSSVLLETRRVQA